MTTWYTTVGFGGNPAPIGPWKDPEQLRAALRRWATRTGYQYGELVNAHTIRVYGYTTREAARQGDISDGPGRNGCVSIKGLHDFMAAG